jgi:hypothetical protein
MVFLLQSAPLYLVCFGLPRFALPTRARRPRRVLWRVPKDRNRLQSSHMGG